VQIVFWMSLARIYPTRWCVMTYPLGTTGSLTGEQIEREPEEADFPPVAYFDESLSHLTPQQPHFE